VDADPCWLLRLGWAGGVPAAGVGELQAEVGRRRGHGRPLRGRWVSKAGAWRVGCGWDVRQR
jgi:hypothetical protein